MNFANNKKERQINKMRQETSQLRETLFVSADLESVKKTASMHLGMVDPNDKQIVSVVVPQKDHMTTSRCGSKTQPGELLFRRRCVMLGQERNRDGNVSKRT